MATQIVDMIPIGVQTIPNSTAYLTNSPRGDQGHGWQLTYTTTYGALTSGVTDFIAIPNNARVVAVTYKYVGVVGATFSLYASCNSRAEVSAGTAIFGPILSTLAPSVTGTGGAASGFLPAAPAFIQGVCAGSGQTSTDAITICLSCVSTIRP